jgi:peptide/nickel transport system permease protein
VSVAIAQRLRVFRPSADGILARILSDGFAVAGIIFIVGLVIAALAVELGDLPGLNVIDVTARNRAPMVRLPDGTTHVLGTDPLGRDVLYRIILGARISLTVGTLSVLTSGLIGITLGLLAGFHRGGVEQLIMRLVDLQMALPGVLIALLVLFVVGPSVTNVILVLALTRWMIYTRLTRAMVLSVREEAYVDAARTLGAGSTRIIVRHILPNLFTPILVLATIEIARVMLSEAALSFLGLGIQPPDVSWGLMLAGGRVYIADAWWLVTFPGIAILLTALSFNLISVAARKAGVRLPAVGNPRLGRP